LLIALDVESMLGELGITDVTTSGSVADAMKKLSSVSPTVAVLDVNLGNETSIPIARELTRRRIPFVFATGYGERGMVPVEFAEIPLVRKPYDSESLMSALVRVMNGGASQPNT
jgi:two-component SAPR family response regulator